MILIINSFDNTARGYDDFSFHLTKSYRSPRAINWSEVSGVGIIVPSLSSEQAIVKVDDPTRDTNYFAKKLLAKIPTELVSVFYIDGNAAVRQIPFEDPPHFNSPLGLAHQELLRTGLAKTGLVASNAQIITVVLDNEISLVAWNKGAPIELVTKEILSGDGLKSMLKPKLRQNPKVSLQLKHYLKELTYGVGGLILYLGRIDGIFMSGDLAQSPNLVREGLIMSLRAWPTTHIVTAEVDPLADAARMISQLL